MGKLAINGGVPVSAEPLKVLDWPPVSRKTADKLAELYLSREWSFNSPREQEFENAFAAYHGARYGIFMANGTVTLECALEVLGVGEGDEVILPGLTWIATAMAIRYVGATPVFADIEASTLCLDPEAFEAAITPRTRAVIPVHLYGGTADLERIIAIARKHDIAVVEDCAHMQGGFWNGRGVGSWGEIGSFSFQQSKTLAAGESGICITDDARLAELLYRCKHIGYSRYDKQGQAGTPPPPGLRCHNYRGLALQAQILSDQLEELPGLIAAYNRYHAILAEGIADVPGVRLQSPGRLSDPQGFYGQGVVFDGEEWAGLPLGRILEAARAEGLGAFGTTYGPVYRHLLFNLAPEEYRIQDGGCPVSDGVGTENTAVIMHWAMFHPESARCAAEIIRKVHANLGELR